MVTIPNSTDTDDGDSSGWEDTFFTVAASYSGGGVGGRADGLPIDYTFSYTLDYEEAPYSLNDWDYEIRPDPGGADEVVAAVDDVGGAVISVLSGTLAEVADLPDGVAEYMVESAFDGFHADTLSIAGGSPFTDDDFPVGTTSGRSVIQGTVEGALTPLVVPWPEEYAGDEPDHAEMMEMVFADAGVDVPTNPDGGIPLRFNASVVEDAYTIPASEQYEVEVEIPPESIVNYEYVDLGGPEFGLTVPDGPLSFDDFPFTLGVENTGFESGTAEVTAPGVEEEVTVPADGYEEIAVDPDVDFDELGESVGVEIPGHDSETIELTDLDDVVDSPIDVEDGLNFVRDGTDAYWDDDDGLFRIDYEVENQTDEDRDLYAEGPWDFDPYIGNVFAGTAGSGGEWATGVDPEDLAEMDEIELRLYEDTGGDDPLVDVYPIAVAFDLPDPPFIIATVDDLTVDVDPTTAPPEGVTVEFDILLENVGGVDADVRVSPFGVTTNREEVTVPAGGEEVVTYSFTEGRFGAPDELFDLDFGETIDIDPEVDIRGVGSGAYDRSDVEVDVNPETVDMFEGIDPPIFTLRDVDYEPELDPDEVFEVDVLVGNTGGQSGSVPVVADGDVEEVTVAPGSEEWVTLNPAPPSPGETTDIGIELDSGIGADYEVEDDFTSITVTMDDVAEAFADFVLGLAASSINLDPGEIPSIDATVENVGDDSGTASVVTDGDTEYVTLEPGESESVSLNPTPPEPGKTEVTIVEIPEHDSETVTLQMDEMDSDQEPDPDPTPDPDDFGLWVEVQNIGEEAGSTEVTVDNPDSEQIELEGGEDTEVLLEPSPPDPGEEATYTITAGDDTRTVTVIGPDLDLDPAEFVIGNVQSSINLDPGEVLTLDVDVRNVGEEPGETEVTAGDASSSVTISPGQTRTVTLSPTGPEEGDEDVFDVDVADDTESVIVSREDEDAPAEITLEYVDAPSEIDPGEELTVDVGVRNVGESEGTTMVNIGSDAQSVTVPGGGTETVTFNLSPPDPGETETFTASVNGELETVTVVTDDEDEDPTDPVDPSPGDPTEPAPPQPPEWPDPPDPPEYPDPPDIVYPDPPDPPEYPDPPEPDPPEPEPAPEPDDDPYGGPLTYLDPLGLFSTTRQLPRLSDVMGGDRNR